MKYLVWSVSNLGFACRHLVPAKIFAFMTLLMKTASLGLLEVMVVRVNAGGDAPPDPPLLVTSWAILLYFRF